MSNPDTATTASSPDADEDVTSGFPYDSFPYFPLEVNIVIREKIHDPQDKLNILETLPQLVWNIQDHEMTDWDRPSLRLELMYPLVYPYLKFPYEDEERSWENVLNLCKFSPGFNKVVLKHFEKYLYLTHCPEQTIFQDYQQEPIWKPDQLKEVVRAVSHPTFPSYLTTLPFGISTSFATAGGQAKRLKKLGKMLWSLEVSLIFSYDRIPGIINYLVKCLQLVPNLRRLGLADFCPNNQNMPPVVLLGDGDGDQLVLPELPQLKMISLVGDCSNCQRWILPKYVRQLKVLHFHDCYLTDNFNPTCFPNLETIHIQFGQIQRMEYRNASVDRVNDLFLTKFVMSPLKVITVRLDEVDVAKFFTFMLTMNKFGKTLETLEMKFGRFNAEMGAEVTNELRDWISQLNLPKLSCLHLDCYVGPVEFLLKMRALRKLSIIVSRLEPLQRSDVSGLNFSVEREVMLESGMWTLFPELEWFKMDTRVYQNARIEVREPVFPVIPGIYITRQIYERHQRNATD